MKTDFTIYQSPFSWRYGSHKMREIFSEINKRKTWRRVWVALARAQNKMGLVSKKELDDIIKYQDKIDMEKAQKLEEDLKHDLMAEVRTYAHQAKIGGGKIHFGATSQDIEDNADALIFQSAVSIIESKLKELLTLWADKIEENKDLVCMAYTHLQPAEPTTLGYRFASYAQDLMLDLELLAYVKKQIKGKGIKGAVGNSASYFSLLGNKAEQLEKEILKDLGIEAFEIATQVYPRKVDFFILTLLSSIAQSLYKFAFDLRIMQSSPFGELAEPFGQKQVGSSAMPFKRNPQNAERICSLARYVSSLTKVAWDNAANSLLERTLDDSASRRIIIPDSFLATDEILSKAQSIIEGLVVNDKNIEKNLSLYGPFSALEAILLKSTKSGANRQEMHEVLRQISLKVYNEMQTTGKNNLPKHIREDKRILKYLNQNEIKQLGNYKNHTGFASQKAQETARKIKQLAK